MSSLSKASRLVSSSGTLISTQVNPLSTTNPFDSLGLEAQTIEVHVGASGTAPRARAVDGKTSEQRANHIERFVNHLVPCMAA
jgi:hypothetical protein